MSSIIEKQTISLEVGVICFQIKVCIKFIMKTDQQSASVSTDSFKQSIKNKQETE